MYGFYSQNQDFYLLPKFTIFYCLIFFFLFIKFYCAMKEQDMTIQFSVIVELIKETEVR